MVMAWVRFATQASRNKEIEKGEGEGILRTERGISEESLKTTVHYR